MESEKYFNIFFHSAAKLSRLTIIPAMTVIYILSNENELLNWFPGSFKFGKPSSRYVLGAFPIGISPSLDLFQAINPIGTEYEDFRSFIKSEFSPQNRAPIKSITTMQEKPINRLASQRTSSHGLSKTPSPTGNTIQKSTPVIFWNELGEAFAIPLEIVLRINQLNSKEKEILEGQIVDSLSSRHIPTWNETKNNIQNLISTVIYEQQRRNWTFPWKEWLNATLIGGDFPEIVPGQLGPLPNFWTDVLCNPSILPCNSLGDWGRAIGIPLRQNYLSSGIGQLQSRIGDTLQFAEEKIAEPITMETLDFIDQNYLALLVESLTGILEPLTFPLSGSPAESFFHNMTETFVWQPLSLVDPNEADELVKQLLRDKMNAAILCRVFNGRLPHCRTEPTPLPTIPRIPVEKIIDPKTGFLTYIFLWGFEFSCAIQGGCIAGTPKLQPHNFDGFYQLSAIGANGQPIYEKKFKETFPFEDFEAITSLFFFQKKAVEDPSAISSRTVAWAGITPFSPSYQNIQGGSEPPFGFVTSSEPTKGLPPVGCSDHIGTEFNGLLNSTFPLCLSMSDSWRLGRLNMYSCTGFLLDFVCYFPAIVQVFPSNPLNVMDHGNEMHQYRSQYRRSKDSFHKTYINENASNKHALFKAKNYREDHESKVLKRTVPILFPAGIYPPGM